MATKIGNPLAAPYRYWTEDDKNVLLQKLWDGTGVNNKKHKNKYTNKITTEEFYGKKSWRIIIEITSIQRNLIENNGRRKYVLYMFMLVYKNFFVFIHQYT